MDPLGVRTHVLRRRGVHRVRRTQWTPDRERRRPQHGIPLHQKPGGDGVHDDAHRRIEGGGVVPRPDGDHAVVHRRAVTPGAEDPSGPVHIRLRARRVQPMDDAGFPGEDGGRVGGHAVHGIGQPGRARAHPDPEGGREAGGQVVGAGDGIPPRKRGDPIAPGSEGVVVPWKPALRR